MVDPSKQKDAPITSFFTFTTHNFEDGGGVETFSRYLIHYSPHYVKVLLFSYAYPDYKKFKISDGTEIYPVIMSPARMAWIRSVSLADKVTNWGPVAGIVFISNHIGSLVFNLLKNIKNIRKSDAIHGMGGPMEVMFTYYLSRLTRKPYVLSYHTDIGAFTGNPFSRWQLGIGFRNARMIGINAQDLADRAIKDLGVEPERIFVMPQRVDVSNFKPESKQDSRVKLKWPSDRKIVLLAGSLGKVKFCDVAIPAIENVLKSSKSMEYLFVIAGDGLLKKEVLALQEKFPEQVNYQDFVPQNKLTLMMNGADAVFGYADVEYAGQLTIETLATGTPVLLFDRAFRLDGLKQLKFSIASDLVFLVPTNVEDLGNFLIENLEEVVRAKEDMTRRKAAYDYVKIHYSIENVLDLIFSKFLSGLRRVK